MAAARERVGWALERSCLEAVGGSHGAKSLVGSVGGCKPCRARWGSPFEENIRSCLGPMVAMYSICILLVSVVSSSLSIASDSCLFWIVLPHLSIEKMSSDIIAVKIH